MLFGYACHNTVTGFYTINGDYAGYAQAYLEQAHPGAVALFLWARAGIKTHIRDTLHWSSLSNTAGPLPMPWRQHCKSRYNGRWMARCGAHWGTWSSAYANISRADLERRAIRGITTTSASQGLVEGA